MASTRGALQWSLIIYNIISVVIAILALSAVAYEFETFTHGSPQYTEEIVEICAACVLLIAAFIGCCGASYNSVQTISGFIIIYLLLLLSHIWQLVRYNEDKLLAATESMVAYKWLEELDKPGAMHGLEDKYGCCGKDSFKDYVNVGMTVPLNCYIYEPEVRSLPFGDGCVTAMKAALLKIYQIEWVVHYAMIVYECLGIILASLLIWRIVSKQQRYTYY